jgi:hypothetical protein|nr:MAG TPA: hypothetical protein [Caudoviricetes sp.]
MNKYLLVRFNIVQMEAEDPTSVLDFIIRKENIAAEPLGDGYRILLNGEPKNPTYGGSFAARECMRDFVKCYRKKHPQISSYKIYEVISNE